MTIVDFVNLCLDEGRTVVKFPPSSPPLITKGGRPFLFHSTSSPIGWRLIFRALFFFLLEAPGYPAKDSFLSAIGGSDSSKEGPPFFPLFSPPILTFEAPLSPLAMEIPPSAVCENDWRLCAVLPAPFARRVTLLAFSERIVLMKWIGQSECEYSEVRETCPPPTLFLFTG